MYKVVVHKAEAEFIKGLSSSDMTKTDNGDKLVWVGWRLTHALAIPSDVLQPEAEVDGAARRHGSFSRSQLRTAQARHDG